MVQRDTEYLLIAIDEADKCPVPLARLIRSLTTHLQQVGVKNVRFILAGVSPYFQLMVQEDSGINRFFYKALVLQPMPREESYDLITTKLDVMVRDAAIDGIKIFIEPSVVERIINLSGGHPHLLQLLGSHLIEHENADPDGELDSRDLITSLQSICYEDRAHVYDATLHALELYNREDAFQNLMAIAPPGFPTRIGRRKAVDLVGKDSVEWLVANNILRPVDGSDYGLVDEFLRIRLVLDKEREEETERRMIGLAGMDVDE
jgi:hypothetical protein